MALTLEAEVAVLLKGQENFAKAEKGFKEVKTAADQLAAGLHNVNTTIAQASPALKMFAGDSKLFADRIRQAHTEVKQFHQEQSKKVSEQWATGIKMGTNALQELGGWAKKAAMEFVHLAEKAALVGAAAAAAGAAMTGLFARAVIKETAQKEKFLMQFETLFGSKTGAAGAMGLVEGMKTPFTHDELSQAIVDLQLYGLEAKKWLPLVANLAASLGDDAGETAHKIGMAMLGMTRGLKQFGIGAGELRKYGAAVSEGGQISVQTAADVKALENALERIIGARFGGATARWSATWSGMWKLLGKQWEEFKESVGEAGFLEASKKALSGLLDVIQKSVESGAFGKLTQSLSDILSYIPAVAAAMIEKLPKAIETVMGWLESLRVWLGKNAEPMWQALVNTANWAAAQILYAWKVVTDWFTKSFGMDFGDLLTGLAYDFKATMLDISATLHDFIGKNAPLILTLVGLTQGAKLGLYGAGAGAVAGFAGGMAIGLSQREAAYQNRLELQAMGSREARIAKARAERAGTMKESGAGIASLSPYEAYYGRKPTMAEAGITPAGGMTSPELRDRQKELEGAAKAAALAIKAAQRGQEDYTKAVLQARDVYASALQKQGEAATDYYDLMISKTEEWQKSYMTATEKWAQENIDLWRDYWGEVKSDFEAGLASGEEVDRAFAGFQSASQFFSGWLPDVRDVMREARLEAKGYYMGIGGKKGEEFKEGPFAGGKGRSMLPYIPEWIRPQAPGMTWFEPPPSPMYERQTQKQVLQIKIELDEALQKLVVSSAVLNQGRVTQAQMITEAR